MIGMLTSMPEVPKLPLLLEPIAEPSWFHALIANPVVKSLMPFPILAALAYPIWFVFRDTWRQIDVEAAREKSEMLARGEVDFRPVVCLVLTAATLTFHEYYGGRSLYEQLIRPELMALDQAGHKWLHAQKYDQLYSYAWWSAARVIGYVFIPFTLWKIIFPKDHLLDYGLRTRGFFKHLWIYGALLAVVVPVMLIVAHQPDFGSYYPFYKLSSRSWFDFLVWELVYGAQFLALEMFFRGWIVESLRRSMGSAAIFVMSVPYCMIHYGKPYLEAHGAIVAGVVLGSLSMKTRSIYGGFLLHVSVAVLMDVLSLYKRSVLPSVFWAPG